MEEGYEERREGIYRREEMGKEREGVRNGRRLKGKEEEGVRRSAPSVNF